jgi:hypothetical protein
LSRNLLGSWRRLRANSRVQVKQMLDGLLRSLLLDAKRLTRNVEKQE